MNSENFANLGDCEDNYQLGARRFDVGETCTATILPGAVAALEQIKEWGVDNISASLAQTNNKIASHLEPLGFRLPDKLLRCPHMFGAVAPKHYKGDLVSELLNRKVHICQRGNALRFSPHLHVNEEDIGRLVETLGRQTRQVAWRPAGREGAPLFRRKCTVC